MVEQAGGRRSGGGLRADVGGDVSCGDVHEDVCAIERGVAFAGEHGVDGNGAVCRAAKGRERK